MDADRIIERLRERIESLESAATLGLLVSAVVHEVNNPLSVIMIGADTLRHGRRHGVDLERHLDVLNQQSDRIVAISRRMQDLARGSMTTVQVADLGELLRLFADLEEVLGGEADRPLLTLPDEPLTIRANVQLLLQVLRFLARAVRVRSGRNDLEILASAEQVRLIQSGPAADRSPVRDYAVARLRVGAPHGEAEAFLKILPDFFAAARDPQEVELMASWEVIRKLSGKLQILDGGEDGFEIQAMIPRVDTSEKRH